MDFSRLDRMISRTIDRSFSVPCRIEPMTRRVNGRPDTDPERSIVTIPAIFDEDDSDGGIQTGNRTGGAGNDFQSVSVGTRIQVSISSEYLDATAWPRQGDRVSFPSRPTWGTFDVSRVLEEGDRLRISLTRVSR